MLQFDDEPDTGYDYLSSEKLEIIYRYLDDQQKLIDPSQVVPLSPSETSISPASTPIAETSSKKGNFNDNLFKPNTDARALYNMFALPIAFSNGSTEILSMSQKSQGIELSDKNIDLNTSKNNIYFEKPHFEKMKSDIPRAKDSFKPLISNLKELNSSKRGAPCSIHTKNHFTSDPVSKKPKNKVRNLPKLDRVNPTENAKRWLDTLHFSEKDFLGLGDEKRLVVINNMLSKNALAAPSLQSPYLLQTESHSRFFPRVQESETNNKYQHSSLYKHTLTLPQKTHSSRDSFDFEERESYFFENETSKKDSVRFKSLNDKNSSEPLVEGNLYEATKPSATSFFENLNFHSGSNQASLSNLKFENLMQIDTLRSPNPFFPIGFPNILEEESKGSLSPSLPIFSSPVPFTEFNIHETLELLQRPSGNLLGCSSTLFYPKKFSGT